MNLPKNLRRNVLRWSLGGLILALGSACAFEPSDAVNDAGTEHTVTVTVLGGSLLDLISEGIPDDSELPVLELGPIPVDEFVRFRVISGPNAGVESNNDCVPACNDPDEDYQMSWTYRSNGVPGTDRIEVCVMPDWIDFDPATATSEDISSIEQDLDSLANSLNAPYNGEAVLIINSYLPQLFQMGFGADDAIDLINDLLDTDYDDFEDALCESVEKTWEPVLESTPERPRLDIRPPNIGAGLSGLFQGQPTPLPTAAAPAPGAPSQSIRPPNTGDAGLEVLAD